MSTTSNQPARGYFSRAASEFTGFWREGSPTFGAWFQQFWPVPVAAFVLLMLAVGWAATPGARPLPETFREKLEATGNWSDLRFVQAEPKKDGGTYVALATYGQKFRCKVRSVGGNVSVQFFRPGALKSNGQETSKPVASYDLGEDGALRAAPSNTESLGAAAQEVIDAIRSGK
jgi:hypothetical protein